MAFMRSSNCPRYFVPATMDAISRLTTRLSNKMRETFFCTIRRARPSAMADFPTPGSPIRMGLFFLRRLKICARRSISVSRPTMGSRLSSSANRVISVPKLSKTGVSDFDAAPLLGPCPLPGFRENGPIDSSSSLSGKSERASGCLNSFNCVLTA